MGRKLSVDIFGSIFDTFWCCVLDLSHFHLLPSKYFYEKKCLIYINLHTFHVKVNSARSQWYSCARYKAPGPLVKSHLQLYTHILTTLILVLVLQGNYKFWLGGLTYFSETSTLARTSESWNIQLSYFVRSFTSYHTFQLGELVIWPTF